jgi:hypothetical protein
MTRSSIITLCLISTLWMTNGCSNRNLGIVPLGETGNGVLICGEAITLNANKEVSDELLKSMFKQAMSERNNLCSALSRPED